MDDHWLRGKFTELGVIQFEDWADTGEEYEMFQLAENSGVFGGLKVSGEPMPQCQFSVEPAFAGRGEEFQCVNKRFFDASDAGPEGLRAFDLRNAL